MITITGGRYSYDVFNDGDAYVITYDPETEEPIFTLRETPEPGALLVGCPLCGVKLKKPRPVLFWPDGSPKCIMQRK
jgi:hypothetical protein